jgi:hypothetical protein
MRSGTQQELHGSPRFRLLALERDPVPWHRVPRSPWVCLCGPANGLAALSHTQGLAPVVVGVVSVSRGTFRSWGTDAMQPVRTVAPITIDSRCWVRRGERRSLAAWVASAMGRPAMVRAGVTMTSSTVPPYGQWGPVIGAASGVIVGRSHSVAHSGVWGDNAGGASIRAGGHLAQAPTWRRPRQVGQLVAGDEIVEAGDLFEERRASCPDVGGVIEATDRRRAGPRGPRPGRYSALPAHPTSRRS